METFPSEQKKPPKSKNFPNVFLDISINSTNYEKKGRIEIELFSYCPLTGENFRCLCTGEKGIGKRGKPLHYKGTLIHRIISKYLIQGGDITHQDGTGGESIYGRFFKDENYIHKHDQPFVVAMANFGEKDTNSS